MRFYQIGRNRKAVNVICDRKAINVLGDPDQVGVNAPGQWHTEIQTGEPQEALRSGQFELKRSCSRVPSRRIEVRQFDLLRVMRSRRQDERRRQRTRAGISRREWLARIGRLGLAIPFSFLSCGKNEPGGHGADEKRASAPNPTPSRPARATDDPDASSLAPFTPEQESFLDEMQRAAFLFFWEQADPNTGQVKDRALAASNDTRTVSSIAATGFGLTALCIADKRGWMDAKKIRERVRNTLGFLWKTCPHERGFFYHFIHFSTGERAFKSEVSSIDSSILFCGVLTCRAYFDDEEIRSLATQLYERADWQWFLNGGRAVSMGWKPQTGFLKARWDHYCELMMIYLLGIGSPTRAIPPDSWKAWSRPVINYQGIEYISGKDPIFTHQYSHAWFDFRGKRDAYADYFENSVKATKAHKLFCLSLRERFPDYDEDLWGITASDSAHGYVAWGGPPPIGPLDGSVVPCAAAGSLPFLPRDAIRVLQNLRVKFEEKAWKRYGFVDAFNPLTDWYDPDVIGLDLGISLVMAENARSGFVWETFMKNEEARRGMERAGFQATQSQTRPTSIEHVRTMWNEEEEQVG